MAFKKGQGGRPKGAVNKATGPIHEAFAGLGGPNGKVYAKQLHDIATLPHSDVHARLKALALIAPYVWGKPTERHEHTGADGQPLVIQWAQ